VVLCGLPLVLFCDVPLVWPAAIGWLGVLS
jgi:hypothetical protein